MAGMCATLHYVIEADELFLPTLQATYVSIWTLGLFLDTIGLLVYIY